METVDRLKYMHDNMLFVNQEDTIALSDAISQLEEYQMFKDLYHARLNIDMVAMLTEIQLEIEEESWGKQFEGLEKAVDMVDVNMIIQRKINELKAESEVEK